MSPWMWNSGITFRQRSAAVSRSVCATLSAEAHTFRCESGTILGRDVVPDVWRMRATSSSSASPPRRAFAAGFPFSGPSPPDPSPPVRDRARWKVPAGASGSTHNSSIAIPRSTAAARAGESLPNSRMTAFASRSER